MDRKENLKKLFSYFILITYGIVLLFVLTRIEAVYSAVKWLIDMLSPVFLAVVIAFILHMPMEYFEYKALAKLCKNKNGFFYSIKKPLSLLLSYICFILFIALFIAIVLPNLRQSLSQLVANFPDYLQNFEIWADGFLESMAVNPSVNAAFSNLWDQAADILHQFFSGALSGVLTFTMGVTTKVVNFLFAIIISGFLVYGREKLFSQFYRLSMQVFKQKTTHRLRDIARLTDDVFSKYIVGQTTEAMILGILCFIGMSLFRMPYALLVSLVISVTALIPILGAWIGIIPSVIMLLMVDPMQAFWFFVFIALLQQFENNFIYPHVVGNAVGLSGLWIIISIIVFGGLFGLWGMILGAPTAAVCYRLVGDWIKEKEKKGG